MPARLSREHPRGGTDLDKGTARPAVNCWRCGDDHKYGACALDQQAAGPPETGLLPQHRRCYQCKTVTYVWDSNPCGSHAVAGQPPPLGDSPSAAPPRDRTAHLQALALRQADEYRAGRPVV
jgi:hypothetical protein